VALKPHQHRREDNRSKQGKIREKAEEDGGVNGMHAPLPFQVLIDIEFPFFFTFASSELSSCHEDWHLRPLSSGGRFGLPAPFNLERNGSEGCLSVVRHELGTPQ